MAEESAPSNVRISVPPQSTASETESPLHRGPTIHSPTYSVMVPVTGELLDADTGINVRRFLQTAIALAADNDGRVLLFGIVTVANEDDIETVREYVQSEPPDDTESDAVIETVTERATQMARIADVAQSLDPNVPITALVRPMLDTTHGVLDAIDGGGSETAVLLLRETSLDSGWILGRSTIDAVLAEAECDVFVENIGTQNGASALYVPDIADHTVAPLAESDAATIDSILLAVGTGPHSALAAEAARAVARAVDAPVTVLHVVPPDASAQERTDAKDVLQFAEYVLRPVVDTETEIREASTTTDGIVQAAQNHDVTSIGVPEQQSRLEQLVFEPVQETLSERDDVTVLMARDSNRTMRSLYYQWKQGLEAISDFETKARNELESRESILEYEIIESSPKHFLTKVKERQDDGDTRRVLYRIEYEPHPTGDETVHWRFLGPITDDS